MLYVDENEKKYIKSLYYTKVINEQGSADSPRSFMTQNQYSGYIEHQNKQIDAIIKKYDITTSEGVHNLLDDSELVTAFLSAGAAPNFIGIFHGFVYFYESLTTAASDTINKIKSIALGIFELILALPGLAQINSGPLKGWIETIKKSNTLDWMENFTGWFNPNWTKIGKLVQKAIGFINRIAAFFRLKKMTTLYKIFSNITKYANRFLSQLDVLWRFIRTKIDSGIKRAAAVKYSQIVDDGKKDKFSSYYDKTSNFLNQKYNTTAPARNYNQSNNATQDTTNPIYYKPKVNPNQPNVKYTK